jgi:hypothetical protein
MLTHGNQTAFDLLAFAPIGRKIKNDNLYIVSPQVVFPAVVFNFGLISMRQHSGR